jgi:hypothetical protein
MDPSLTSLDVTFNGDVKDVVIVTDAGEAIGLVGILGGGGGDSSLVKSTGNVGTANCEPVRSTNFPVP